MSLRASNKERRRRRILRAARAIVLAEGAEGLSMRKVARAAGLSVTTLYNLLGSKEALRAALCADLLDGIDRELERTPLERPIERARAVITVGVGHMASDGEVMRAALLAGQQRPDLPDVARPRAVEMQRAAIQAGMDAGLLRADLRAELLAAQVYEGFIEAALRWARGELDDAGFRDKALYSLHVCLLAAATEAARPALVASLRALEPRVARAAKRAA